MAWRATAGRQNWWRVVRPVIYWKTHFVWFFFFTWPPETFQILRMVRPDDTRGNTDQSKKVCGNLFILPLGALKWRYRRVKEINTSWCAQCMTLICYIYSFFTELFFFTASQFFLESFCHESEESDGEGCKWWDSSVKLYSNYMELEIEVSII